MDFTGLLPYVPVVIGLVQVIKDIEVIPVKYTPLVSLVVGVGIAYFVGYSAIEGAVLALMASGLFSTGQQVFQK